MDKFYEKYKWPQITKVVENVNHFMSIKEIECII